MKETGHNCLYGYVFCPENTQGLTIVQWRSRVMNNSNNHRSVTIMHNNKLPVNYPALILSIYMACYNQVFVQICTNNDQATMRMAMLRRG